MFLICDFIFFSQSLNWELMRRLVKTMWVHLWFYFSRWTFLALISRSSNIYLRLSPSCFLKPLVVHLQFKIEGFYHREGRVIFLYCFGAFDSACLVQVCKRMEQDLKDKVGLDVSVLSNELFVFTEPHPQKHKTGSCQCVEPFSSITCFLPG